MVKILLLFVFAALASPVIVMLMSSWPLSYWLQPLCLRAGLASLIGFRWPAVGFSVGMLHSGDMTSYAMALVWAVLSAACLAFYLSKPHALFLAGAGLALIFATLNIASCLWPYVS